MGRPDLLSPAHSALPMSLTWDPIAVYVPSSTRLGLGRTVTVPRGHVWLQVRPLLHPMRALHSAAAARSYADAPCPGLARLTGNMRLWCCCCDARVSAIDLGRGCQPALLCILQRGPVPQLLVNARTAFLHGLVSHTFHLSRSARRVPCAPHAGGQLQQLHRLEALRPRALRAATRPCLPQSGWPPLVGRGGWLGGTPGAATLA